MGNLKDTAWIVCCISLLSCCHGEADPERRRQQQLKQDLLYNYSTTVSPYGTGNRVNVSLSFAPIAVVAVEEASQIFRLSGSLTMSWKDPWLTWNNTNGVESLAFKSEEIWTPNFIIPNAVGNKISSLTASMPINVRSTGTTLMFIIDEFETICNLDVTRYPYDEQECHMSFLGLLDSRLYLRSQGLSDIFSAYFTGSSEWELVNTTFHEKHFHAFYDALPYIDVKFRLRRHSIFYTLSVIFPMCLLSFLNACVFLLPAASGEKISFLVSIFVSGAVFLNYINDAIPKSGNASRLTIYLVLLLSQSALALLATLLVINTHHRQGALLCRFSKKVKVTDLDNKPSAWNELSGIQKDEAANRLDKILFVMFVTMAAASILVFYV
ncbi:neuronal acetylcholine receptor subunit non-alpha-2-like [Haliotis cracherodii]|uniref:neuronal acetylcholine receptor subunit non-alpha-2-like n=1 Tax=Haliotis cracherodii TaxID=6455 RepID=UPI0039EBE026